MRKSRFIYYMLVPNDAQKVAAANSYDEELEDTKRFDLSYVYQKYLLDCEYQKISLEHSIWNGTEQFFDYKAPYNLFDYVNQSHIRYILLSELDSTVDTQKDFDRLVNTLADVDILVILNDRPVSDNCHFKNYSDATLKAYIFRFKETGIKCYLQN